MSQTTQQEPGAVPAKPKGRKDWEWFWRVIAFLMLLLIVWVAWVAYQIAPRSVVTPLAYATRVKPIMQQPAGGTAVPAATTVTPALSASQPAPEAAAPDPAAQQAQAVPQSGTDQAAADVPAPVLEQIGAQKKEEGLRLATEISTPLAAKPSALNTTAAKPGGGAKDRP